MFKKTKNVNPAQKIMNINFYNLNITLKFKKGVKYIRLKVSKEAKISMSLPFYCTQKNAILFLQENRKWLEKVYINTLKNLPKNGEIIYLGKNYKLEFDTNVKYVLITNDTVIAHNEKMLQKFKKEKAREIFTYFIEKFRPIINKNINRLRITSASRRWGSCNTRKGYINLSINLLTKSPHLIEYVVLHEMTHLIYPHHQHSFYKFIKAIMPDFRERELNLKG